MTRAVAENTNTKKKNMRKESFTLQTFDQLTHSNPNSRNVNGIRHVGHVPYKKANGPSATSVKEPKLEERKPCNIEVTK